MQKVLLKFWIEDVKGSVLAGTYHTLTLKVVPELEYFKRKRPFICFTTDHRVDKYEDGDCEYAQPGFLMFVQSYEVVEEQSDKNWKDYIDLKVFDRLNDLQISVFAKQVPVGQHDETDGELCLDIPELIINAYGSSSKFKESLFYDSCFYYIKTTQ